MVALGLTGVLWQSVTQRTREIGLRRAKGATRVSVQRQISRDRGDDAWPPLVAGVARRAGAAPALPVPARVMPPPASCSSAWPVGRLHLWADAAVRLVPEPARDAVQPAEALRYE